MIKVTHFYIEWPNYPYESKLIKISKWVPWTPKEQLVYWFDERLRTEAYWLYIRYSSFVVVEFVTVLWLGLCVYIKGKVIAHNNLSIWILTLYYASASYIPKTSQTADTDSSHYSTYTSSVVLCHHCNWSAEVVAGCGCPFPLSSHWIMRIVVHILWSNYTCYCESLLVVTHYSRVEAGILVPIF